MSILRNIKQSQDYFEVEEWRSKCTIESIKMVTNDKDEVIGLEVFGDEINLINFPPYPIIKIHSKNIIIRNFYMGWFDWIPRDFEDRVSLSIQPAVGAWMTGYECEPAELGDFSWFNSYKGSLKIYCKTYLSSHLKFDNKTQLSEVYISDCGNLSIQNINTEVLNLYNCNLDLRQYSGSVSCLKACDCYINDYDAQIIIPNESGVSQQTAKQVVQVCIRKDSWEKMTGEKLKDLFVDDVMTSSQKYEMKITTSKPYKQANGLYFTGIDTKIFKLPNGST